MIRTVKAQNVQAQSTLHEQQQKLYANERKNEWINQLISQPIHKQSREMCSLIANVRSRGLGLGFDLLT